MDDTLPSGDPPRGPVVAPGGRIGKYEVLRALGSGGMGTVWAARDPDLDREVAIKLLRATHASPEQRTRLLREARAMARLKHPNVLTVYEVDSDGNRDFIVMELVDGASLDVWLRERPPVREVWDALLAAGKGLEAAHDAGLVHRDFKPHNVLRSHDGRVLVTDFGLARGRTDGDPLAATLPHEANAAPGPRAGDSVLDAQLTTTGQLLGTPAYMAPEQYAGSPPDPRTDQFAFCATLWEALAGEHPFPGTTIEELREQVMRGVPAPARLPASVRAVLVRGLSPDRAKRWPDMASVLRALERARRSRARWLALGVPVVAAGVIAASFALRSGRPAAPVCEPGGTVFASTWSPAIRAEVLAKHPKATELATSLDMYRERWLAGYAQACAGPAVQRAAAVSCYLGARDELAVTVEALQRFDDIALASLDVSSQLAPIYPCAGDAPVALPRLPDDERRPRVIAQLAKLEIDATSAPRDVFQNADSLRLEAKALAWPPLAARAELAIAVAAAEGGKVDVAHASYRRAADLAHAAHDVAGEALARLGVLESGRDCIGDELPQHAYEDELREADVAIQQAGNAPALRAELDESRALHTALFGADLSGAIEIAQRSYDTLSTLHDVPRLAHAAAELAEDLVVRAAPGDLERAGQVVSEATRLVESAPFRDDRQTTELRAARAWVAWQKGDLDTVHAALDAVAPVPWSNGSPRTGLVVDAAGVPVAHARVVAWTGDLFGDATRVYTSPDTSPLAVTTTDDHGAFTIAAAEGGAVMAELDGKRSTPTSARDGLRLTLRPTRSITGTIESGDDPPAGIDACARIDVSPTTSWFLSTGPTPDGHYTLAGLPADARFRLGAVGRHWPREPGRRIDVAVATDHAVIRWPPGGSIDYATANPARGTAWVLPGMVVPPPKTRAAVERLARTAFNVATVPISPVGWANTSVTGLLTFAPGRHHAVIRDNPPGLAMLCMVFDDSPEVTCKQLEITEEPEPPLRDHRRYYGGDAGDFDPPSAGAGSR